MQEGEGLFELRRLIQYFDISSCGDFQETPPSLLEVISLGDKWIHQQGHICEPICEAKRSVSKDFSYRYITCKNSIQKLVSVRHFTVQYKTLKVLFWVTPIDSQGQYTR